MDTHVVVEGRKVRLAQDPEGRPAVLVPASARPSGERLVTRGLVARIGALGEDGKFDDWLQITCIEPGLNETFAQLSDDVIAVLERSRDEDDPVEAALAAVERWRKLLAALANQQMSEGQAAGLLSELHVLEALTQKVGAAKAMNAWVGHDRARVDFRFARCGIEVKATLQRDRFRVTVHGLLQLDPHEVGDLYLYGEQLERVPSGGDSVPAAADRLIAKGIDAWHLTEGMAMCGYRPIDEAALRLVQFKVLDSRTIRVGVGTPRVVKESFVNGAVPDFVSGLTYQLDLTDFDAQHGLLDTFDAVMTALS